MELKTALTLSLGQRKCPIITVYDFGILIFQLYQARSYRGEALARIQNDAPNLTDMHRIIEELSSAGILYRNPQISSRDVFSVIGKDASSAEEVACCIDPFAYISHLSAMEWHGITDRFSKTLFLSSPPSPKWGEFARQRMRKDLGEDALVPYKNAGLPVLRKLSLNSILRKSVHRYASLHPGAFTMIKGRPLRVSTIGRTFLDMLRKPDLCGGIYHVLEVYEEHAARYLRLIVDEVDRHGTAIDKVRTGYVLEERCSLAHPTIDGWLACVQRGGSRKLYADADYSSVFSEKWSLSVNIEE